MNKVISAILIVSVAVVTILVAVRIMLSPLFIQIEYRTPNFPADPYGFTFAERMHWADLSRQYLLNADDISFLGNLEFDDGTAIYNERELKHMLDVKIVVGYAMWVLYIGLGVLVGAGIWAIRNGQSDSYWNAISNGGWLTVAIIIFIVVMIFLSFNTFFVAFHRVFFEGDTWLFLHSDTLIRLFPERFWRDAFLMIGGFSLLVGLGLGWGLPKLKQGTD